MAFSDHGVLGPSAIGGSPISQVMDLCVALASGQADELSGRYLSVDDDLADTVAQASTIVAGELHTLRIGRLLAP